MMNRIGVAEAYRMAQSYQAIAGEAWTLPAFFKDQSDASTNWDFSYVDSSIEDGIATITINRPEAMNALNEVVVAQLTEAVQAANADSNVTTIVLDGAGKAFVAGADVKFFVDKIRSDDIPDIETFTENGHVLLAALEDSSKTTIALTTGLALGGGLNSLLLVTIALVLEELNSDSQRQALGFTLLSEELSDLHVSQDENSVDGLFLLETS